MRRLFWVAVGVGVSVVVLRKLDRASGRMHALAPASLAESVGRLADSLRDASAGFSAAMAEHEARLTETLLAPARPTESGRPDFGRRSRSTGAPDGWGLDSDDPDLYL